MKLLPLSVVKDEEAPAIALLAVVVNKYGLEAFGWDPAILRLELEEDFGVKLTDLQSDKIQAAITVLTTNMFEETWESFTVCCHTLCGIPYEFEDFNPLEAEYISMALAEVTLIKDGDLETFSDEVRAFAGNAFYEYGMRCPPKLFENAIMPSCQTDGSESSDKNDNLQDLFDERTHNIKKYLEAMTQ